MGKMPMARTNYNNKEITLKELSLMPECEVDYKCLYNRIIKHKISANVAIKKEIGNKTQKMP